MGLIKYPLTIKHSYGKSTFIDDFPIKTQFMCDFQSSCIYFYPNLWAFWKWATLDLAAWLTESDICPEDCWIPLVPISSLVARRTISDSSQKMTFAAQENDGCCCCCCCCLCWYSHDRVCKLCIRIYTYIYMYLYYTHCSITVANLLSHPTIDYGILAQSSHSHFIRRPRTML